MKRRSALDNLRPWAAWLVRRRMWLLALIGGAFAGFFVYGVLAAWEFLRAALDPDTFREAWRDMRQAAREAAAERAAKCPCVDCGGNEPAHSTACEYMRELHGGDA